MLRKSLSFIFLFSLLNVAIGIAQIPGVYLSKGAKRIEIPFERQDNFIIVKVLFQGFIPLKFIVDTGAEHTILTQKEISDLMRVTYEREITIMGTDMKTLVKAYITRKIRLELSNLTLVKDILVLDDDYFKFGQFVGLDIHGILGAETFKGYVLKIDYEKQVLTLIDPSVFKVSEHRRYEELPIEISKSKPYIYAKAQINRDTIINLKLLMDTGASLAMLLHTNSTPGLVMPEKVIKGNIGNGLGGQIEGFMGRVSSLKIGQSTSRNILSHYQELNEEKDSAYLNNRHGLLGGEMLCRFNIILDFNSEKVYFQPNKSFKTAFDYDKSGLVLIAGGEGLNKFTIFDIIPNTPAEEAQLLRGDEVLSVNNYPARWFNLGGINRLFQGRDGKKIKLKILRDGKKMIVRFRLRKMI